MTKPPFASLRFAPAAVEVERRDDCFGCHRVDAVKALRLCGTRDTG